MSGFSFLKSTTVQSVHISSDVVFFIHSAEKMKPRLFSLEKTQTFFFEKKNNMANKKKYHLPAPPILNVFSKKFHGLVLGLEELIDAKCIGVAWLNLYGHEAVRRKLKKGLKTQKMHFLPVFELMSGSLE